MNYPVAVNQLQMEFSNKKIIDDLSFQISEGTTFGLLGSNGSGKTTIIRTLLGIYQPTSGDALINGKRYSPADIEGVGYLPEERGLYKKEITLDVMIFFGKLRGLSGKEAKKRSLEFLEQMDIADKAKVRMDRLSGGQQQKVQLGVTLISDPKLLILDEPGKGFDPVNRRILMGMISQHQKQGATIVLVTHDMSEVEKLCSQILLLKDGKARAYGDLVRVQQEFGGTYIELIYTGSLPESNNFKISKEFAPGHLELQVKDGLSPSQIVQELTKAKVEITLFRPHYRNMDEIFVEIYGEKALKES